MLQWVVVGILLGIGFVFPWLWLFGLVGVAGCIYLALHARSIKKMIFGGLLAWTIKSALALVWFWTAYPMDWLQMDLGYLQLLLIFVWWGTASIWLGFGGVFFVGVCRLLLRYTSLAVTYATIPFIWIGSEMFGSLVFSIITIGPGGSITTAFSFGYIGYLLFFSELLIQAASIYGVYSLGLLLVGIVVSVYSFLQSTTYKKYGYAFVALFVLISMIPFSTQEIDDETYLIAVIDTDYSLQQLRSVEGRRDIQEQLEYAMQEALNLNPDYILLPEDASYFDQQSSPQLVAAQFSFRTQQSDVIIVDSGRADDNQKAVVQSFVYNGKEGVVDQSHKRYLVPQGEFMPSLYAAGIKLFGRDEIVDQFAKSVSFEVGSKTEQINQAQSSPGILFCFESVSPWGVKTILNERGSVPFIAHPISHSWFNQPESLWSQLTGMLQVQSIWSDQYIVSVGNEADSQVFTPDGGVTYPEVYLEEDNWQLRLVEIPRN